MTAAPMENGEWSVLGRHDLHIHTTMSDGDLPLEEVVAVAAERDLLAGIADHISTRHSLFISDLDGIAAYLDELERVPVLRGGEFCWCDPLSDPLPAELAERFDYRIGSNHGFALPDGTWASPWWEELPPPWRGRPDEVMEIMVHNLCDLLRAMRFDILAHATLLPPALRKEEPDIHAWWTEEREDRFVEALLEGGMALEISNRYRLPHDRLLRKAREAGARFTLGSDGHHREQVCRLEWAVETAGRVGIGDRQIFVPPRE